MKEINFIKQIEQAVDEIWKSAPPRIEFEGWWWKRYIPYYQRLRKAMQNWIDYQWQNEYPQIKEQIERMEKDYFADLMRQGRNY